MRDSGQVLAWRNAAVLPTPGSPVSRPMPGLCNSHWKRSLNCAKAPSSHNSVCSLESGAQRRPKCCLYMSQLPCVVALLGKLDQIGAVGCVLRWRPMGDTAGSTTSGWDVDAAACEIGHSVEGMVAAPSGWPASLSTPTTVAVWGSTTSNTVLPTQFIRHFKAFALKRHGAVAAHVASRRGAGTVRRAAPRARRVCGSGVGPADSGRAASGCPGRCARCGGRSARPTPIGAR